MLRSTMQNPGGRDSAARWQQARAELVRSVSSAGSLYDLLSVRTETNYPAFNTHPLSGKGLELSSIFHAWIRYLKLSLLVRSYIFRYL